MHRATFVHEARKVVRYSKCLNMAICTASVVSGLSLYACSLENFPFVLANRFVP